MNSEKICKAARDQIASPLLRLVQSLKIKPHLTALASSTFLIACSAPIIESHRITEWKQQSGVSYYLPKRLHLVTVERTLNVITSTELAKLKAAADGAKKTSVDAKKEYERLKAIADIANPASKPEAEKLAGLALAESTIAANNATKANVAYEAGLGRTQGQLDPNNCPYKFTSAIAPQPMEPDPSSGYIASLNHISTRHDDISIKTSKNGLLGDVTAVSDDQTGTAIASLAQAISGYSGGLPSEIKSYGEEAVVAPTGACDAQKISIQGLIDFSDDKDLTEYEKRLQSHLIDPNIAIAFKGPFSEEVESFVGQRKRQVELGANAGSAEEFWSPDHGDGLYYRREFPYIFFLGTSNGIQSRTAFTMPNLSPPYLAEFTGSKFIKSEYNVTFEEGILVSSDADVPSEFVAVASLPINVLKAMVSVVTEIIQFRVNYTTSEVSLAEQEKLLKDAIDALENTRAGNEAALAE